MVSVQRDPPFGLFSEGLSARLRALGPRGQSSLATITASPRSRSRGPPHPDRKAWVRYVPPRWIYAGAAIGGVPSEVRRAMLRGWYGHNGVSLGNPCLGCTTQTMAGQPDLVGYYLEYDQHKPTTEDPTAPAVST